MMWAEHIHRLESLSLLSAQWQRFSLERCGQIFFGGVFDKRVGMLFAARRNEDGNVHRRRRVSKTVTKNMWEGFFKNQNQKERPEKTAEGGNAPLCGVEILTKVSARLLATFSRLVDVEVFLIKTFSLLKSKVFCSQIVCKYFDVVQKLTASAYGHLADRRFELRIEVCDQV